MTVVAGGLIPAAAVWAQEKDEVPARATWRPQAPERPELPPGVNRKESAFKVERPKADLPGLEPDEDESVTAAETAPADPGAAVESAPAEAEVSAPAEVEPVEPEPASSPPPRETPTAAEPLRESRVENPETTGTVQASTARSREPPSPIPGTVVQPEYPRDALLDGEEGYVTLEFTVTRRGAVSNVAITESEPEGVFEEAVRDAIRRWEFEPATENGQPVDQRVRHRFDFNMGQ